MTLIIKYYLFQDLYYVLCKYFIYQLRKGLNSLQQWTEYISDHTEIAVHDFITEIFVTKRTARR